MYKIYADLMRYKIEFSIEEIWWYCIEECHRAYKKSLYYSKKDLSPDNILFMGLVLNYSNFLITYVSKRKAYEFLKKNYLSIVNYMELNNS